MGTAAFKDLQLPVNVPIIVVPPWGDVNRPALNAHILQACARRAGVEMKVVYANVLLASVLGEKLYQSIAYAPQAALLGEGIFSSAAFNLPSIIDRGGKALEVYLQQTSTKMKLQLTPSHIIHLENVGQKFAYELAEQICKAKPPFVGATSTFEQTSPAIAILENIKKIDDSIITILGGANCEGIMAEGIRSLKSSVNYIFSGESENTFVHFVTHPEQYSAHAINQIIVGKDPVDLDSIPQVDYTDYYTQRERYLPFEKNNLPNIWLSYETSRGCWWGAIHHCTFCGLNADVMKHREKSPEKVKSELKELSQQHVSESIWIIDNIMPFAYFKTLLPELSDAIGKQHIYWDQKSNLTLEKVMLLKKSGVEIIQPGIESFSSHLLKKMDKGVTASQNIKMLRYTRALDLKETWNILFGFPGDRAEDYSEQVQVMNLIHHLQPPTWLARINIDRFSPYFSKPETYGVKSLLPFPAYWYTFPRHTDIHKIAYHFYAQYESAIFNNPQEVLKPLCLAFDEWRYKWTQSNNPPPVLHISRLGVEEYLLMDTRQLLGTKLITLINRQQAKLALIDCQLNMIDHNLLNWALHIKVGLIVDNRYVALATANYELLSEFEKEAAGTDKASREFA